jgi:hypothetical protein
MRAKGRIRVHNRMYDVSKGAGVYLDPGEAATMEVAESPGVKPFHLLVPKIPA